MRLRTFARAIETLRVLDEAQADGLAQPHHVRQTLATLQGLARHLRHETVEVLGIDWAGWRRHTGDVALRFIVDRYRVSGISVLRRLRDGE